jgi:transposase
MRWPTWCGPAANGGSCRASFRPSRRCSIISTRGATAACWSASISSCCCRARETAGREPSPSAGVIENQSVKTTEAGGPRGFDAAKKIKDRKRHIITDTTGLLVAAEVHRADGQDRDGAPLVIAAIQDLLPWLCHLFADSAYAGDKVLNTLSKFGNWTIEIVRRTPDSAGFQVLSRRWIVERTLAWLNRNRRLAKDLEATIESAKAWIYLASVQLLIRRMART